MIFKKNKRGVSEIIGYILLIAIVVVISIFVFQWLKSYVPQDALTCPDGTAISIPEYEYDCDADNILRFTVRNDGTFSIAGYFIHASEDDSTLEIATLDLTPYYIGPGNNRTTGGIIFSPGTGGPGNSLNPGEEETLAENVFTLGADFPAITAGTLDEIEIIPIRYIEYKEKQRIASCGNAKINIPIACA